MFVLIYNVCEVKNMAKQTICLVGRPNTGKSTLFNRIVGRKVAIIEDAPGVTRDRIYSQASFNEKPFYLIDTGGIDLSDGDFNEEIRMQVEVGIEEADTIIFVVADHGHKNVKSIDLNDYPNIIECFSKKFIRNKND